MDDLLEKPTTLSKPESTEKSEDAELSSEDEDGGLDWTKLPSSSSRPVIPKRGDKDFEPIVDGGSGFQRHVLDGARTAMFDALRAERNTSSKSISYGVWYPNLARTHVTTARRIHFTTMGHSIARSLPSTPMMAAQKIPKRVELLPEEAIYLIERGSMFCWKALEGMEMGSPGLEDIEGAPMTVQQAFAEMIGTENLSLEKYQVFAYLKRLGYVVMRTNPPSPAYLTAAPYTRPTSPKRGLLTRFFFWLSSLASGLVGLFNRGIGRCRPYLFRHGKTYPGVFASLRFLPSGHKAPLYVEKPKDQPPSPYQIFYNVYKPATSFKKTAPPPPDFQVVVVNARTTPVPTLPELTDLFDLLPELPPPVPRRRLAYADQKKLAQEAQAQAKVQTQPTPALALQPPPVPPTLLRKWFSWILPTPLASTSPPVLAGGSRPNPFAVLKQGKKMVVVAAVDVGIISFFSFRQGAFEEIPMM